MLLSANFEQVKNWLTSSGLYVSDEADANYGAVNSFFDEKANRFGFLYSEITGYYISTMCFLYDKEKNQDYVKKAQSSVDWLIKIYERYGGIIQGISQDDSKQNLVYSFDTAICAKGLLDYYKISQNEKYLEYSLKMIDTISNAIEQDGTIRPFKKTGGQNFEESSEVWYKQKGCLHIKNAMTFAQLYETTKEEKYLQTAKKICDSYAQYQNKDGSISLHKNGKTINLHALCYALEGLLYCYHKTKDERYLKCCIDAVDWCATKIQGDGSIELWFNSKHRSKASYPVAQLIRIMILLDILQKNTKYKKHANALHSFLVSMQSKSEDVRRRGAFYEETYKSVLGWKKREKLNSWASMFALQALYWHENYDSVDFGKEIGLLY